MRGVPASEGIDRRRLLGELIEAERQRLGRTKRDVGHSIETYDRLADGLGVRRTTYQRAARALGLTETAIDDVLAGRADTLQVEDPTPDQGDDLQILARVREFNGLVIDVLEDATPEEIDALRVYLRSLANRDRPT